MSSLQVFDKSKQQLYVLDTNKEIARGGEGFLLSIPKNKDLIAKIYFPNCLNINEQKFSYLHKLDDTFFIKPQELLYNKTGKNIIGITMKYLNSDYYPLDVIFNRSFCLKNNINISIKEKITNNLIQAVKSAHKIQIEIGDLSGLNVMVNNQGDIKIIDVDSFQVPGVKHSNKLLEDIRDYLHGGNVSVNSDFFALSVIVFNYLTFLHPFKGIHKKFKTLSERMINKKPVFSNDPDLIIPKCYEKIGDSFLQKQFEDLYLKGDRFLISINKLIAPLAGKPIVHQNISEKDVLSQYILLNTIIEYAYFNNKFGMIRTAEDFLIYDVSNKGMFILKHTLSRKDISDVFIGTKNILISKKESLFIFNFVNGKLDEILNFKLKPKARYVHNNNYLIMLDEEFLWEINLDEVKYNNILVNKINIYSPSFQTHTGIIQNVGGVQYLCTNIGRKNNFLPISKVIRGFFSFNDIGIIKFETNKKIKYNFFNISNSTINILGETEDLYHFAYKGENFKNALIFIPGDKKISILRGIDFYKLADIDCSVILDDTRLFNTEAGIVAVNENSVYLVNKK